MSATPHFDKLRAALSNPKCDNEDVALLKEGITLYQEWNNKLRALTSKGKQRVDEMTKLLNWYKYELEVERLIKRGTEFIGRQRGQLKLESSILEEFLVYLIHPTIIQGLENIEQLIIGPRPTFMSVCFFPSGLSDRVSCSVQKENLDFVIGREIFYRFSIGSGLLEGKEIGRGSFTTSLIGVECKINLDKTMFGRAVNTAAQLKRGTPNAKFFLVVEYLDMVPEDLRTTAIDNVFLLRHAKRLPVDKRDKLGFEDEHYRKFPIDANIVWEFISEIQAVINTFQPNENEILKRGSFM